MGRSGGDGGGGVCCNNMRRDCDGLANVTTWRSECGPFEYVNGIEDSGTKVEWKFFIIRPSVET